jgi:cytochrome oxidase Cu insertion factor (SCO1/SenC/PrrC family)
MRLSLIAICVLAAAPLPRANAQPQSEQNDKKEVGIKVGEMAPVFKLKAQDGKPVALKELLKKDKVALVFFRSADW